jgi:hypothetical protein
MKKEINFRMSALINRKASWRAFRPELGRRFVRELSPWSGHQSLAPRAHGEKGPSGPCQQMTERYAKLVKRHIARTGSAAREMWRLMKAEDLQKQAKGIAGFSLIVPALIS